MVPRKWREKPPNRARNTKKSSMDLPATEIGGAIIFILQLALLFVNLKVRAELAELKLHMYQHFVSNKTLETFIRTGVIANDRPAH